MLLEKQNMDRFLFTIFTASLTVGFVAGYTFGSFYTIQKRQQRIEDVNIPTARVNKCSP